MIRANLERKGLPIGCHDLLIATHAFSLNLIVVTANEREFSMSYFKVQPCRTA
jgi:tRNA(fMet)-specific endonuclease VapC